jgi:hypothetical protein
MPTKYRKCAHPACNCTVRENSGDYCSPYCHDAADTIEISCNCGHTECSAAEGVPQSMTEH